MGRPGGGDWAPPRPFRAWRGDEYSRVFVEHSILWEAAMRRLVGNRMKIGRVHSHSDWHGRCSIPGENPFGGGFSRLLTDRSATAVLHAFAGVLSHGAENLLFPFDEEYGFLPIRPDHPCLYQFAAAAAYVHDAGEGSASALLPAGAGVHLVTRPKFQPNPLQGRCLASQEDQKNGNRERRKQGDGRILVTILLSWWPFGCRKKKTGFRVPGHSSCVTRVLRANRHEIHADGRNGLI